MRASKRAYIHTCTRVVRSDSLSVRLATCIRFHACLIAGFNFGFETHDHVFCGSGGGAAIAAKSDDSRMSRGHTYNSLAAPPDQITMEPIHDKLIKFTRSPQICKSFSQERDEQAAVLVGEGRRAPPVAGAVGAGPHMMFVAVVTCACDS